jgi:hypothetical protein
MNKSKAKVGILTAMAFALLMMVAAPATSFAQGNGHGRGNGRGRQSGWNSDKKLRKFVNGHDARDGRLDGRGPHRRNLAWRNEGFVPRGYRVRNRLNNGGLRNRSTWTLAQRRAYNRRNR